MAFVDPDPAAEPSAGPVADPVAPATDPLADPGAHSGRDSVNGSTDAGEVPGEALVNGTLMATAVFVVTSLLATLSPDGFGLVHKVVCSSLFVVGCAAFLWGYGLAVARSRTETLSIAGLYFLAGGSAPPLVRRRMMGALVAQVVVALVTAAIRPLTDVAFGVLVPLFGLGMAGLWGGRHGLFEPRDTNR